MKRSAFAELCGVSKQMISKYAGAGLVVEEGGDVDAAASLERLAGRLDEDKRLAAIAALQQIAPQAVVATTAQPKGPAAPSAKVQKDEIEVQLKRLQYGREAGELVNADEVGHAARHAVASMREAFGNRRREIAETICLQFGLTPEKASPLGRLLSREFEATLGVFGEEMAILAAAASPGLATPQSEPSAQLATA